MGSEGLERPLVNIIGEQIALGPLQRDLLPVYQRWINDFRTLRTLGPVPRPMTMEQEQAWFESAAKGERDVSFTIYELSTWRPIGNTGLHAADFVHRSAEFGILIGEPDARGKGYGTEAAQLMLDYGFTALGLHNIMLRVFEYNLAGLHAYRKAGFREFGRRHQTHSMGGRLWDEVYMECLANDFTSPLLARVLSPDEPRA
ncbi:MAG: GNAT family N-acetyltransferase [Dehalococcoidia bacterium]